MKRGTGSPEQRDREWGSGSGARSSWRNALTQRAIRDMPLPCPENG